MGLLLTVATNHKMSTTINPPPCIFSPSAYKIWCWGINYFYGLVIIVYYYFLCKNEIIVLNLLVQWQFSWTQKYATAPNILCLYMCGHYPTHLWVWWFCNTRHRIIFFHILIKNITSLIDVNIIPCQLVPHLVDQGIPNPSQIHQIHIF